MLVWISQLCGRKAQRCTTPLQWREEASCQERSMSNELFPVGDIYLLSTLTIMEVTEIKTDIHFGKQQFLTPQTHPEPLCWWPHKTANFQIRKSFCSSRVFKAGLWTRSSFLEYILGKDSTLFCGMTDIKRIRKNFWQFHLPQKELCVLMQVQLLYAGGCKNAQWLWVYASREEIDKKKILLLEKNNLQMFFHNISSLRTQY